MVTNEQFRSLALSFPGSEEKPHFEKTSFRIKKKIFATLDESERKVCLKLSESDQDTFSIASEIIYPVPNKWGKQGWTFVELKKISKTLLKEILTEAYQTVAG